MSRGASVNPFKTKSLAVLKDWGKAKLVMVKISVKYGMKYNKLQTFYHVLRLTSTNLKMLEGNARSKSGYIFCVK